MTCPDGHTSTATDFCDVCGAPIAAAAGPDPATGGVPVVTPDPASGPASAAGSAGGGAAPAGEAPGGAAPAPAPATTLCPNCGAAVSVDALFCESCGRDMVTGQMPSPAPAGGADPGAAPATPAPSTGWVAEVWVDEDWFAARGEGRCPTVGAPRTFPVADGALIGRHSSSRGIDPDVDCSSDGSVSGRQALLGFDGARWTVTDLGSTNGTFVAHAGDPTPTEPLEPNQAVELESGDRILIGAHTRVVVRPE